MSAVEFLELSVSLSVQAGLLVAAAYWLCRVTRNERAHCGIWTSCYVMLLLLIAMGVIFPHVRPVAPWTSLSPAVSAELLSAELRLGRIVLIVWMLGALVSAMLLLSGWLQVFRFLSQCRRTDMPIGRLERLSEEHHDLIAGMRVELLSSPALMSPFCSQFHRPYIVLPEFLLDFSPSELRFVIRHELEHLRSGHPMQLFVQRVVEILLWFHPLVWWASNQSALAREFACDDAAIDSNAEIAAYLRTLLKIVERNASPTSRMPTPLGFGRGKRIIARRARRLAALAQRERTPSEDAQHDRWIVSCLPAIACLIALVWLPVNVAASPHSSWSPWPRWTARILHDVGDIRARDYELYSSRHNLQELVEARDKP